MERMQHLLFRLCIHVIVDVEADKEMNLVAMEVCKVEKGMDEG